MKPSLMKPYIGSHRALLGLVLGLALTFPSALRAFPPAPDHTIFGLVRDEYGQPLTQASAQIIFKTAEGVEVTGNINPNLAPGINYRIKIAMDSGTAPDLYKPTALKPTAPFRIRVKIGTLTYLPMEMVANFANLGKPAQSTRIDLTLGVDANGDGLPDAWQDLLRSILGPGALTGPNDDADGDGISNLDEYLAGTYAFDPEDGFRLKLVPRPGDRPLLEFMVINPRTYTIYSSTNLQNWIPLEFKIPAGGPSASSVPNYRATDIRTLQVEPILAPGLPASSYYYRVQAQ